MNTTVRIPCRDVSGLEPTDYIAPEALKSGKPNERGRSFYADQTGQLDAGYWECDVNEHVFEASPYDEFVHILEGDLEITHDDGSVAAYKAGDSFVMPRGCACTWNVKAPLRKVYVVLTANDYRDGST